MRVMVLGGTRFIGAAIVEELHGHGHELLLVHRAFGAMLAGTETAPLRPGRYRSSARRLPPSGET
jgi:nucleoside-diphosphate-sugar epimerase